MLNDLGFQCRSSDLTFFLKPKTQCTFSFCLLTSFGLGWIYTFESLERARTCGEFTGIGPRLRAGRCGRSHQPFSRTAPAPNPTGTAMTVNSPPRRLLSPSLRRGKLTHTRNLEFLATGFDADIST
jgi:hypothetical protein